MNQLIIFFSLFAKNMIIYKENSEAINDDYEIKLGHKQ